MRKKQKKLSGRRILTWMIAFAIALSVMTIPEVDSYAAGGTVKTIAVTNLPAKQLTLKKGKTFTLKTKVTVTGKASKKVTYKTSNKKVATVTAKGKITAKKKGRAKIYVISKADKKKKCTITVTVGTPVTKVKLNKKTSKMTVGKKQTLKATVTPKNASNKAVVWKTSDKKIATITSKGVVKAKKAGTVTITAIAKDGSGTKASCKITVKKAANPKPAPTPTPTPTPEKPLAIQTVNILNKSVLQVTLNRKSVLQASDFTVKSKVYGYGSFVKNCTINRLETADHITYKVYLDKQDILYNGNIVQVSVPKLNSTKELTYQAQTYEISTRKERMLYVGITIDSSSSYNTYKPDISGYASYTVRDLPTGITYKEAEGDDNSNYLIFSGTLKEAGCWETKIDVTDEFGNKIHHTLVWKVYDKSTIAASDIISYKYLENPKADGTYSVRFSSTISVKGGSGSYTYEVVSKQENMSLLKSADGMAKGSITPQQPGTYTMKVKITDKNDASIFTYSTVTFVIKKGIRLTGTIVDLDGNEIIYIEADAFKCYIKSQRKDDIYNVSAEDTIGDGSAAGEVYYYVPEGVYDIWVEDANGDTKAYLSDFTVSETSDNFKLVLPIHQQP